MQLAMMHRVSKRLRALVGDRRANTAVEFALAAPALFLFLFGIIETGYALWMQNALDYSVAAAARCASLSTSQTSSPCGPSGGNSQVTTYAASESGASLDNTAFAYNSAAACGCQVTGSYPMSLDIPWANFTVTLSSSACIAPPPQKNCAS
jgi:Flp pilus assembly protein TadG